MEGAGSRPARRGQPSPSTGAAGGGLASSPAQPLACRSSSWLDWDRSDGPGYGCGRGKGPGHRDRWGSPPGTARTKETVIAHDGRVPTLGLPRSDREGERLQLSLAANGVEDQLVGGRGD